MKKKLPNDNFWVNFPIKIILMAMIFAYVFALFDVSISNASSSTVV